MSGFGSRKAAEDYAQELEADQRRGIWLDPAGAKMRLDEWVNTWIDTIDVETRTEESYRRCLRLHILPPVGLPGAGRNQRLGGDGVVEATA